MGQASKRYDPSMFIPAPVKLTDAEANALVDRLQLKNADAAIQKLVIATEEQRREHQAVEAIRNKAFCAIRAASPNEIGEMADSIAQIVKVQRLSERGTRAVLSKETQKVMALRSRAERRSPQYRAVVIPLCDRYLAAISEKARYFRNSAIQFEALFAEALIGDARSHPGGFPIDNGAIRISVLGPLLDELPSGRRQQLVAGLRRLSAQPKSANLQLTPIGVTATMWIALVDYPNAVVMRREHAEDKDNLLVVGIVDFQPIRGDNLKSLSGGASWSLQGGRIEITADEIDGDEWLKDISKYAPYSDEIVGDMGEEAVEW